MALFKCMQSGNVFEFLLEHDIRTMRAHPEYEEVIDAVIIPQETTEDKPAKRSYTKTNKE